VRSEVIKGIIAFSPIGELDRASPPDIKEMRRT